MLLCFRDYGAAENGHLELFHLFAAPEIVGIPAHEDSLVCTRLIVCVGIGIQIVLHILHHGALIRRGGIESHRSGESHPSQ